MGINLADLMPSARKISTGSGELEVRGLPLSKISELSKQYGPRLTQFMQGETMDFALLVEEAPDLVASIICAGTGTAGQEEVAKQFPVWIQIEAVTAIWEESVPDLKKLVGLLSGVANKLKKEIVTPLPLTSTSAPELNT
jgi:hypothetical protein